MTQAHLSPSSPLRVWWIYWDDYWPAQEYLPDRAFSPSQYHLFCCKCAVRLDCLLPPSIKTVLGLGRVPALARL